MRSASVSLAAAVLLLTLVVLGMGIAATNTFASQNKSQDNPTLSDSISSIVPEKVQSIPQAKITTEGSSSATVDPRGPHFFLQERKSSSGILASGSSSNVFYNGGPTMHTSVSYAIFWLPSGNSFEQSAGSDTAYMSLINRFLNDTSGTSYYNILNQYPDNINGTPLDKSTLGGSYLDTAPYPANGTQASPLHDSDIQAEVIRAMTANSWVAGPNKMFHVFTGYGIQSCFDPSNSQCTFNVYCAYHSYFTQGSQSMIYSNMPDFNGISGHCTPRGQSPPNGDYYADPEINILSHELFEAVSDPLLNAWNDGFSEIADKCAWNFGAVNPDGSNLGLNGHKYLVQLEWSNYGSTCILSYGPSHMVSIAPSPGSYPFPSTIIFNITYTSQGSNWWTTTSYTNGTITIGIDKNTPVTIVNRTPTTSQTEKWCFDQKCADVSFGSSDGAATTYYYFDLLAQRVSVSIGAAVPSASLAFATGPVLPNTLGFPQQLTIQLNQATQTIWVQRGTTVSASSPTNVGVDTRWVTRINTWTIFAALQIPNPILYYPQYLTTFEYTVSGGGTYSPPSVTYYDTGLPKTALAGTAVWADSDSTYDYQSQLPGSTQYERWSTTALNGLVPTPGSSVSTNYFHQYSVTISSQFKDGSPSTTPSLIGETYGLNIPTSLSLQPSTIWLDAGSAYSLTNTLAGTIAQERWYAATAATGVVAGAMVLSPIYSHQYFLTVTGALPGSSGQGWYDAGSEGVAVTPNPFYISSTGRIELTTYSEDGAFPISLPPFNQVGTVGIGDVMDRPHTIQFSSKLQYSLTSFLQTNSMASIDPSPTGDSWYDNGTSLHLVLSRDWDTVGNVRQSLVSYSLDNVAMSLDRTSNGPVEIHIPITTSHILSESSVTQYFVSVQGLVLLGSQSGDGWFDSGSQFTVQGAYDRVYTADKPYFVYGVPVGFQILANTTVSSVVWTSSGNTLSFDASHADVIVYVPKEFNLKPTKVLDDGMALVFSYSSTSDLLSFRGSSDFHVSLSSTSAASSILSNIPDWVLYPVIIVVAVGVILIVGLLLIGRPARKTAPQAKRALSSQFYFSLV